jgi:Tol biopolymer transport system component
VVAASTTGVDLDADGYTVVVDGQRGRPLGPNGEMTMADLEPGEHLVGLEGWKPSCEVQGENPRPVNLAGGATTTVTFYVACAATTGALTVHTVTTGDALDPDGYSNAIDGVGSGSLAANGSRTFSLLPEGEHEVAVAGVITNCRLEGEPTRPVSIRIGQTVDLTLSVACVGRTLHITTATTGRAPDADGYAVAVDSAAPEPVAAAGCVDVDGLLDGEHTITLSGIAPFCDAGDNPRTLSVSEPETTIRFDVACDGPPTDGRILFTGTVGSDVHVFVIRPDGSGRTDLTPGANGSAARWSPDRSKIVFESTRSGASAVFVMNANGSHPTRLAAGRAPAWSPDGGRIAFIGDGSVTVMNADGSARHPLVTGRQPDTPAWSPDGHSIAYSAMNSARCILIFFDPLCARDLYVVDVNGGGNRQLTFAPDALARSHDPAWSPDGSSVAYWRSRLTTTEADLYQVAADGTEVLQVTATIDSAEGFPVWSPDGRALAFGLRSHRAGEDYDIALIPRQGGTPIVLLPGPGDQVATSWR